jgi:hypothetical protein
MAMKSNGVSQTEGGPDFLGGQIIKRKRNKNDFTLGAGKNGAGPRFSRFSGGWRSRARKRWQNPFFFGGWSRVPSGADLDGWMSEA